MGGYSKALYSNWLHYKPDHLLIDCGEGAATALGNNCFSIERVLLTHGHIDHVGGIMSLLWARAGGMGDNEKPLEIYFPTGDVFLPDLRDYIEAVRSKLPFHLQWIGLEAGQSFELKRGRHVECFATQHVPSSASLGYRIGETRKRLKKEWAGLAETEIRRRIQNGATDLMENYSGIKLAHGGDGLPLRAEDVASSEILVHEATLLEAKDRKGKSHSTLAEALDVAIEAQPGTLLLNHISGRFKRAEVEDAIREGAMNREISFPIWCLRQNELWPVWNPDSPAAEPI